MDPLERDASGGFGCRLTGFMSRAATTCDVSVDVRLRTATGNPFFATGPDIYVNDVKLSRMEVGKLEFESCYRSAIRMPSTMPLTPVRQQTADSAASLAAGDVTVPLR